MGQRTVNCDKQSDHRMKEKPHKSDKYEATFRESLDDPEKFWAEIGHYVDWTKPWDRVLDNSNEPFTKWFVGGETNACYNAVDRHVAAGLGSKVALIHDSPMTQTVRRVTYAELLEQTSRLAGVLHDLGVSKGDRVVIYMPVIPETIVAMLAVARLGAVHSVVFGGYAAKELETRINHAEPKAIIAASCGLEPNKVIRYTDMLNEALSAISAPRPNCLVFQRRGVWTAELRERQYDWDDLMARAKPHPCVPVEANEPLYVLYTSGTTDKPKGVQRPLGGHIATLCWTMKTIYGMDKDSVWLAASDLGWVLGSSYTCYAPLLYGCTSVLYEGKPDRTPNCEQYFRLIEQHGINGIFTVPTAFRVLRAVDPHSLVANKYSLKTLKVIYVAGEHCDHEAKAWAEKTFKVPVLNHWWQTETGHSITASCLGLGHSGHDQPEFSVGMPFPGYDVRVLREDGSRAEPNELGRIMVKLPLPPGTLSTLYRADDRFESTYFSKHPGYYDTMDAGYVDAQGYVYVTARDDDVINVAGHRLSTSAVENVVFAHPDVSDAAVFGVPDYTKGQIPACLYVPRAGLQRPEEQVTAELVARVRESIGPVASFKVAAAVRALPRTRTGKACRKAISDMASSRQIKIPSTIEDASAFIEVKKVLQKLGYAENAPDPI